MNVEEVREYCLSMKEVSEGFPFDDTTLVFKVAGKMFALLNLKTPHSVNLKCDPEEALVLRERYPGVTPGYHMNKVNWNTVVLDGNIPGNLIREWIEHSYQEVVKTLPKYVQERLKNQL